MILFLIYGAGKAHLNSVEPKGAICPNCNSESTTVLSVYRRHGHVFWIPLFPMGKTGGSICKNCNHEMKPKQMDEGLRNEYDYLKKESKGPIWQFAGLAILVVGIAAMYYLGQLSDQKEKDQVANPQIGDVYVVSMPGEGYSTLKVKSLSNDSVFVMENMMGINKLRGISEIDKQENYFDYTYGISRSTLIEMKESREIKSVRRDWILKIQMTQ